MGFEFGSVAHLDVQVTLISFVSVIVFIVVFDMATGIMEYFLGGSKLYSKMIQTIYKELMLMGLVSFIVVITEGAQTTAVSNSSEGESWFTAVDFSHILLFFVTCFFVVNSFYLMRASMISGRHYKFMFGEPVPDLIECVEDTVKHPIQRFLYEFDFLPLSFVRERVEFRIIHVLFRDAYCLPEDFHFAYYLSGCFDRYALKTTNRSMITWFVLIVLAILNFARISIDFGFSSCTGTTDSWVYYNATSNSTTTRRRLEDELSSLETSTTSMSMSDTSLHSFQTVAVQKSGIAGYDSNLCRVNLVKLFLVAAVLLCLYNVVIVLFSRLYKLR